MDIKEAKISCISNILFGSNIGFKNCKSGIKK